jgi:hypothetical protein
MVRSKYTYMILHYNYVTLHLHVHLHYHLHYIDLQYITFPCVTRKVTFCCLESCYIHYIHYISYIQHMLATCEALGVQEDH